MEVIYIYISQNLRGRGGGGSQGLLLDPPLVVVIVLEYIYNFF